MTNREEYSSVFGLLAKKHGTDYDYVWKAITKRKSIRGKAARIKEDWNKIQSSLDDWISDTMADGTMRFVMPKGTTVYVQRGIARVYLGGDLKNETSVETMTIREFQAFLNDIRLSIN